MVKQAQKIWSREVASGHLKALRKELDRLDKATDQGRKMSTSEVKDYLERIDKPLAELEKMIDPRVRMPQALKKALAATIDHIKKTNKRIEQWTITEGERLKKIAEKGGK